MPSLHRLALPWIIAAKALLAPVALGAVAAIEDGNGKVLLVRQSYTKGWLLPGGGVGRGEAPAQALVRELEEEIGLTSLESSELFALYTRGAGWATNVVALYRVRGAAFSFKPNFEIREILWADPENLPQGVAPGTAKRLAELAGKAPCDPYW